MEADDSELFYQARLLACRDISIVHHVCACSSCTLYPCLRRCQLDHVRFQRWKVGILFRGLYT